MQESVTFDMVKRHPSFYERSPFVTSVFVSIVISFIKTLIVLYICLCINVFIVVIKADMVYRLPSLVYTISPWHLSVKCHGLILLSIRNVVLCMYARVSDVRAGNLCI